MSITQPECVFVALVIHHAMGMCHTVIHGLSGYNHIFPHYLANDMIFGGVGVGGKLLNMKCVF
jgi:hypothetical protein